MPMMFFSLFAAIASVIAADAESRVVHVSVDGWAVIASAVPESIGEGDAVWTWSRDVPPRRAGDTTERRVEQKEVRVVDDEGRAVAHAVVRWGTAAMLREIPDALLPLVRTDEEGKATLLAPADETVYARAAGSVASQWTLLREPATSIATFEGMELKIDVRDFDGEPASRARVALRFAGTVDEGPHFRAAGDGVVVIPPIPANALVHALIWSDDGAPMTIVRPASSFPRRVSLPRGFALTSHAVDEGEHFVDGAIATATFVAPGESMSITKRVRSSADGGIVVRGLTGDVAWRVSKSPFAAVHGVIRIVSDVDLADVILRRTRDREVMVTDVRGTPIEGARIENAAGEHFVADVSGRAKVRLPETESELRISARGFLPKAVSCAEGDEPIRVRLDPAARVRARIVRASDGAPAGPGTVDVDLDGAKRIAVLPPDGVLDLDSLDEGTMTLVIHAVGLAPFRVPRRTIAAGETVDLGTLALPRGLTIAGRVVDDAGAPLGGVRIRALRPDAFGPQLAFIRRDWVENESAIDGMFALSGLAPGTYALWTEAANRAPVIRSGIVLDGASLSGEHDLGTITIPAARTLTIACTPAARCGSQAAVILEEADWLPIAAPLHEGESTIAPLPEGRARLRLSDRGGIIHERDVDVGADGSHIDIRLAGVDVAGVASRGGSPLSGGTLMFSNTAGDARFVQVAQPRAGGAIGNEIFGTVPRILRAPLSESGRFELRDATPGEYFVTWSSIEGQSLSRAVTIRDGAPQVLQIDFPGTSIAGVVRKADGMPAPNAFIVVEQHGRSAKTMTDPNGAFSVFGLSAGAAVVRASAGRMSARKEVTIEEGRVTTTNLVLDADATRELLVIVEGPQGALANAFVFVRQRGRVRAVTTAADGRASIPLLDDAAPIEIAAYAPSLGWSFAQSQPAGELAPVVVRVPHASAGLLVSTELPAAAVTVEGPAGFPLHEALAILGVPAITRNAAPFRVHGLPAGMYRVAVNGGVRAIALRDEIASLEF